MNKDFSELEINLYQNNIGKIIYIGNDRSIFTFNKAYIEDLNRPILSLGFKNIFGKLITEYKPTQTKLLPFFSNLLPEGHMRKYLANLANINPEREFHLLGILGEDLPGAITVNPLYHHKHFEQDKSSLEEHHIDEKNHLPLSKNIIQLIEHHISTVPIAQISPSL